MSLIQDITKYLSWEANDSNNVASMFVLKK